MLPKVLSFPVNGTEARHVANLESGSATQLTDTVTLHGCTAARTGYIAQIFRNAVFNKETEVIMSY